MSSYNELIALINGCINRNGVQAITGRVLNGVLRAMVNQLGAGYAMGGVAHPTDDPGTPDAPVCYYASEVGTYTHFGNIQIVPGELALLCFDLTDGWFKETMYEGFESVQATIDGNVGTPAVNVTYVNGVLSFDFSNMKGNTGAAAGFGNVTAAVDGTSGTPGVSVQTDGPDTAKNIAFQFTGLKGETGVTSVIATVDNTSGTPQCAVSLNSQQLTLAFTGLKGAQGDTGSSVDYPFTIVNNLTTNDATQALSAAMGVQLESEVSQLEAKVNGRTTAFSGWNNGHSIYTNQGVGNVCPKTMGTSATYRCVIVSVQQGLLYIINGTGGTGPRLWCFLDSEDKILSVASDSESRTGNQFIVSPPTGATQLIINSSTSEDCYEIITGLNERVEDLEEGLQETNIELSNLANIYSETPSNYEKDVCEVYLESLPEGDVVLKCYSGRCYLYTKSSGVYADANLSGIRDGELVTIKVGTSSDPLFPIGKVVGYVILNSVSDFVSKSTPLDIDIINRKRAEDIHFSPNVQLSIYKDEADIVHGTLQDGIDLVGEDVSILETEIDGVQHNFEQTANTLAGYGSVTLDEPLLSGQVITEIVKNPSNMILWLGNGAAELNTNNITLPYTLTKDYTTIHGGNAGTVTIKYGDGSGLPDVPGILDNIETLQEDVAEIQNQIALEVKVHLPSKIYAVVGDTLQIFYRSIIGAVDPYIYDIVPNCSKGNHYPRYWQFTPEISDIGTHTLSITIKDRNGNTLGTGQTSIVVVAAPSSPVSLKNIFCFGDSLTKGVWSAEVKRRLVLTNTVDEIDGDGLSNIAFCGEMQKTINGTVINYFGVGGWTWLSYITKGTPAFRFQVSGVTSLSLNATYTNNGHTYTIKEINVTGGTGNILCETSDSSNTPTASGTLAKASGDGDATIAFSSADADNRNPLWDVDNDKMSFIPYVDDTGNGQIDAVCVLLSWNDQTSWKEYSVDDVSGHIANAKVFLDTLHDEYPSAKCFVMGLQMPSINGGLGANYGASGGYIDRYGLFETVFSYNEALEVLCLSADYNSFCEFVPVGTEFDSEYNMPSALKKVNKRNATTERLGTNGVHPDTSGQYQIADAIYRTIVANFCQSE